MATLEALGDRYWALGLPAAARSAYARAVAAGSDAGPAARLAELALAQGDPAAARRHAQEAVRRAPVAAHRILLGRAQLAAGELAAARMSLLAALDAGGAAAARGWDRARATLALAQAAAATGDRAGAAALAAAAFEAGVAAAAAPGAVLDLGLLEELVAAVVAHGRAADAAAAVGAGDAPGAPPSAAAPALRICRALLLAAQHAGGDGAVRDGDVEAALEAAVATASAGDEPALRARLLERRLRRRLAPDAQAEALAELEGLAARVTAAPDVGAAERARVWFLVARACEEVPEARARAEEAYRRGLALQPGHTAAACRLALLVLDRGDQAAALAEIERALRIDATHGQAWRGAARMLDAQSPGLAAVVGRLLDAAQPGAGHAAGGVAPRLVTATAEVARHDVLAGVYAHGHRVKNLLGIIGARARSARKLAAGEVGERLRDLEADVTALYEEWARYLRSMQEQTPTVELVTISTLLHEVVVAAQARTQHVGISLAQAAALPDVRGDRMLLREALLNVVSNAAEACASGGGQVEVRVRAVATAASPLVEVVVVDSGPGIPRAHHGRLFVPGFTTKETGSGVGLALAERAIAAHHGRIAIDSEEGRGTTVTITLPTDRSGLATLPLWVHERGAP